jgi:hypothetical protein
LSQQITCHDFEKIWRAAREPAFISDTEDFAVSPDCYGRWRDGWIHLLWLTEAIHPVYAPLKTLGRQRAKSHDSRINATE